MQPPAGDDAAFSGPAGRGSDTVRLLHVDDDPAFAELTATVLEDESARLTVTTETEPLTALDRIADDPAAFDCILADYEMPRMNGLELLRTVREKGFQAPYILFTGKGSEAIASQAISAGVTDYIQKEAGTSQYTIVANRILDAVRQHRTEEAVARKADYYRDLVESAPVPMTMYTREGEYVYLNQAAAAFFGVDTPTDLLGCSKFDVITADEEPTVTKRLQRLEAGESIPNTERTYECLDGAHRTGTVSCCPAIMHDSAVGVSVIRAATDEYRTGVADDPETVG